NGDPPVADLRTIEELCQPSLNGRGGPIAPIAIQAMNFGLKNDMTQQVKFFPISWSSGSRVDPTLLNDFEMATERNGDPPVPDLRTMKELCQLSLNGRGNDANKHLDKFLHVTQSIKVNGVTDDALRLYLFPHSLTNHATAWFDHFPRNSINTFEQMAKMFLGKYFPPSMVTKLRNEITNFRQRPDESLFEAWERYKLSIDRCSNHNMLPVTQIDTFYNRLTLRHRDTINGAAVQRSESSSSITSSSYQEIIALKAKMAEINKNLMKVLQINQQAKAVTPSCETYGGPHSYNDCPATVGQTHNVYVREPTKVVILTNPKGNNQGRNQFFQGASYGQNPPSAYQAPAYQAPGYQAPVHQPLIPQSGTAYPGPTIPTTSSSPKVVERETKVTKDTVPPTNNGSTKDVQPPVVQVETSILNFEPVVALVAVPIAAPTRKALIDAYEGELTLRVGKEAITFNLDQTSRYSANYNDMMANRIDVIDMACKEYSQEVLDFSDVIASGNLTYYDPIVSASSSTLTPFGDSDFLLEEVDAFLPLEDYPTSPEVDHTYYDPKGDILLLEAFLNDDPLLPPPNQGTCMMAIFHDMIKKTREVFMDDFSVFRNSFETCLFHLEKILQRCEETNLCLNWEKSQFMVKEGIVLGHKISKNRIEVNKSKVDVIAKLPHPTTVKARKPLTFSRLARMDPPGEIMARTTPPRRCLTPDSIGPQSTVMPITWSNLVTLVNVRERFHNEMKCLKFPSKFAKFLTFGASISWGHSRLHEGTSIYLLPSIICQNGLKQKRFPPMMPELFANT
nr:reverse transcriptase domain-containing protein [Tanacetum cinerariifolium]